MKPVYIFLADGFEEVEALATLDVLRRGGVNALTVSIMPSLDVTGSHGVTVKADKMISDISMADDPEFLVLPGGMPGASNLAACKPLCDMLVAQNARGGKSLPSAPLLLLCSIRLDCSKGIRLHAIPEWSRSGLRKPR